VQHSQHGSGSEGLCLEELKLDNLPKSGRSREAGTILTACRLCLSGVGWWWPSWGPRKEECEYPDAPGLCACGKSLPFSAR